MFFEDAAQPQDRCDLKRFHADFFADEIFTLWLGMDYLETASILKVLFLAVVFRSMSKLGDSLLRAKDAVYQGSLFKAIYVLLIAAGIWWGTSYGMQGVALGIVMATIIHYLMNMFMTTRLIELSWWALVKAWVPGLILGAICLLSSWTIHTFCSWTFLPSAITLLLSVIFIPASAALAIFAFPHILGKGNANPLLYLPARIKEIKLIGNLIGRIK
jgi:O-antigen/teichoic acid export membrane protein